MTNTEVATQRQVQNDIVLGGQPRYNLAELMELSRVMAIAGLVPDALRGNPADVLIIIMKGQDLGLSPSQAIDAIHAIKGKATLGVHLAVALTRQAGHRVDVDETADSCTVTITRKDDPTPVAVTFTVDMAKRAGIRNEKYQSDPQSMLYARAATRCVRRACPEVLLGIVIEGEIVEAEPEQRPTLAQVAAERVEQAAAVEPEPVAPAPAPMEAAEPDEAMLAELADIEQEHVDPAEVDPLRHDDRDLFAEGEQS